MAGIPAPESACGGTGFPNRVVMAAVDEEKKEEEGYGRDRKAGEEPPSGNHGQGAEKQESGPGVAAAARQEHLPVEGPAEEVTEAGAPPGLALSAASLPGPAPRTCPWRC